MSVFFRNVALQLMSMGDFFPMTRYSLLFPVLIMFLSASSLPFGLLRPVFSLD
jgi:hypothetical protein